jgi:hypothetical protein
MAWPVHTPVLSRNVEPGFSDPLDRNLGQPTGHTGQQVHPALAVSISFSAKLAPDTNLLNTGLI